MRKVLLVDDEKLIRAGLRAMIERADTEFTTIEECETAGEAIGLISSVKYDLVITDIKMPDMDGISLIREVQELEIKPVFIILSGYDDFHYARESIKYGAKAYLLKPVGRDELIEALHKASTEIYREEQIKLSEMEIGYLRNSLRQMELYKFFKNGLPQGDGIKEVLRKLEIDFFDKDYYICVVVCRGKGNPGEGEELKNIFETGIGSFPSELLKAIRCFLNMEDSLLLVLKEESAAAGFIDRLNELSEEEYVAGISNLGRTPEDIHRAYNQACQALKYRIIKPLSRVIRYSAVEGLNDACMVPEDLIRKIPHMLGTDRIGEAEDILGKVLSIEALSMYNISCIEKIADCLYTNIYVYFMEQASFKIDSLSKNYGCLKDVYYFKDLSDYFNTFRDFIFEINDYIQLLKDTYSEKDEIDAAIAYILENYHKDLSLTVVANQVSLSYSYFSDLFRKRTGLSFISYLRKFRIRKAKEMLKNTDCKINEIAQRVGYQNPKHFTKAFRMITGISPQDYRKKPM